MASPPPATFFSSILTLLDPLLPNVLHNEKSLRDRRAASAAIGQCRVDREAKIRTLVDAVETPYGLGRFDSTVGANAYKSAYGNTVKVLLDWAVVYMPLHNLVPLQVVKAPHPIGFVALDDTTLTFTKKTTWGSYVVDPSLAHANVGLSAGASGGVERVYSFAPPHNHVRVSTPFGAGELTGHSRPDGILQVKLKYGTAFVKLNQLKLIN